MWVAVWRANTTFQILITQREYDNPISQKYMIPYLRPNP